MSFNKNKPTSYRNHESILKDDDENASIDPSSKKKTFRQSFNSLNGMQCFFANCQNNILKLFYAIISYPFNYLFNTIAFHSSSSSKDSRSILRSIKKRMSFNKTKTPEVTDEITNDTLQNELSENVAEDEIKA
jgi:hypothetical protein